MKNSNPNEVNQSSVGGSSTQYFQTDDNPHFQAEAISSPFNRDIKIKLIFIVVVIIFLIAAGFYLKQYFSDQFNQKNNIVNRTSTEDLIAQRKAKIFDPGIEPSAVASTAKPLTATTPLAIANSNSVPITLPNDLIPSNTSASADALANFHFSAGPQALKAGVAPSSHASMMLSQANGSNLGNSYQTIPISANHPSALVATNPLLLNPPQTPALNIGNGLADSTVHLSNTTKHLTIEQQAQAARQRSNTTLTATAQISASQLGRRSFVLTKGSFIPCVLETQLISNVFGMTSCVVTHHVYSDDGKVILLERGSKATGNYGSNLRNGDSRLAVVWDRIKSPKGVVIDINSPATDGLGAMGLSGTIDKHWFERIGGAVLLSLLQDTVQYASSSLAYHNYIKEQQNLNANQNNLKSSSEQTSTTFTDPKTGISTTVTKQSSTGSGGLSGNSTSQNNTPNAPIFNSNQTNKQSGQIAEQVLSASINAAPTLYKNRGDLVYIFVANDLWFDSVYELTP